MNATSSMPDRRACERARQTRDVRFDGLFFTAVTSTRIYCRPVCPAPAPKDSNIVYYASAAAASAAGFRPCLRCRPEAAPGSPLHRARSELVAGALRLIEHGALDDASLPDLAARVGVGERHLRRLFAEELGASPLDVAATRRLLFAKKLLTETALPITSIASASGYSSVRRFNATFVATYGKAPRDFRRARDTDAAGDELTLRLPYRPPYDFAHLIAFLEKRTIPGVERVDEGRYARSFVAGGSAGWLSVTNDAAHSALILRVHHAKASALGEIVARARRMFDVDADPRAINAHLRRSPLLKPLVARWPGQRLPNAWDGFELAVRAILGQQVSVAAARTLAARIADRFGSRFDEGAAVGLHALFPEAQTLVDAPLETVGVMKARANAIRTLARARPARCVSGRRPDFAARRRQR
jgi:AraC family transcriptional regulator, regulatory protein of adaptative response / DNA-3-methyladenine glycosylase II